MNAEKYNSIVPANIERLLKEKGLKQGAVAERAGYTDQQLCDMIKCRRIIKACDILAIADAIGVNPGELYAVREASA